MRQELKGGEYGFLLLTSNLGDPDRKPLTVAQFRELAQRSEKLRENEPDRDLTEKDLLSVGYGVRTAQRILALLRGGEVLDWYLTQAGKQDIVPITRATRRYPVIIRQRLGMDAPGCLWGRGDLSLLETPTVSLVGSRELREENRAFAEEVGRQAARQGLTLVSGNARGADKAAQDACLAAGGKVISVVADSLLNHRPQANMLYLSESSYDEGFTAQRALSRNRVIHALGRMVFVAQSDLGRGGTWDGTAKNLRCGWSTVCCFDDGSPAMAELSRMGGYLIGPEDLADMGSLAETEYNFLTR